MGVPSVGLGEMGCACSRPSAWGVIMKRVFLAFTVVVAIMNGARAAAPAQAEPVVRTD